LQLDEIDLAILEYMAEDGRYSLRDLARRTGLSAPAVGRRLRRLRDAGVLGGVRATLDLSRISGWTSAIVLVRAEPNRADEVAERAAAVDGTTEVHRAAGPYNVLVRVEVGSADALSAAVREMESIEGVRDVDVLILGRRVKQEPPRISGGARVKLRCDYCGSEISGDPHELEYRGVTHFFCCPTCLREFKAEHGIR
jgi:DNA-binding Lrp family transcriptional regulator